MKNKLISALFLSAILVTPTSSFAQATSFGSFDFTDGQASAASNTSQTATASVDEATIFELLKNKPLSERRKIVARQLETIALKLELLLQKTSAATTRLAQNDIDTTASTSTLTEAQATLTDTKALVATLITTAEDPANESVQNLSVQGVTFKEAVVKAETGLRTTREQIIAALGALKLAVTTSVLTQ